MVITNMPRKRIELVYDVIGQCGQGYQRESSVLFLSVDVNKGCVKRLQS